METIAALADLVVLVSDLLAGGACCFEKASPHARAVALGLLFCAVAPVDAAHNLPAPADSNLGTLNRLRSRTARVPQGCCRQPAVASIACLQP
jgi:hypothetical protein